jgi:hypothetical protein
MLSFVVTVLMLLCVLSQFPTTIELKRRFTNTKPQEVKEDMITGGPGAY